MLGNVTACHEYHLNHSNRLQNGHLRRLWSEFVAFEVTKLYLTYTK